MEGLGCRIGIDCVQLWLQESQRIAWEWRSPLVFLLVQILVFLIFFYFSPLSMSSSSSSDSGFFRYLFPEEDEDRSRMSYSRSILSRLSSFSSASSAIQLLRPTFSPAIAARLREWARRSATKGTKSWYITNQALNHHHHHHHHHHLHRQHHTIAVAVTIIIWKLELNASILISWFAMLPCKKRYTHTNRFFMTLGSFCSKWLCLQELVGRRLGILLTTYSYGLLW